MVRSDPGYFATNLYEYWSCCQGCFLPLLLSIKACLPVTSWVGSWGKG